MARAAGKAFAPSLLDEPRLSRSLRRCRWLLALAAGAMLPLALAPFDLWPLMLVAAAALFWLLAHDDSYVRTFWHGWLFGVGKYGVGASWIYVSIHVHGHAPPPLAAALVAVFVAGLALTSGALALLFLGMTRRRQELSPSSALVFAGMWTAFEWLLTWLLTGFPWLFAGYAFIDTPLAGWAPVGGALLLSLLAVGTATLSIAALRQRRWWLLAAVLALWLAGGALRQVPWTQRGETRTVALVQGNLPQETKWTAGGLAAALQRYGQLSADAWRHDIVVWPEAAIPDLHHRVAEEVQAMRPADGGDLLWGALVAEVRPNRRAPLIYNAAVSSSGGEYRKRRLVPFGEYVPLEALLRGAIAFFDLPMSRTAPGAHAQPKLTAADTAIALAICYEVAYGNAVARDARSAALLATISNDTWFGTSIGPPQHMQIARARALENGKYLIRATNNGITAIVDDQGAVVSRLPQFVASVLTGTVHANSGTTPYGRFGDLVAMLLASIALGTGTLIAGRNALAYGQRDGHR